MSRVTQQVLNVEGRLGQSKAVTQAIAAIEAHLGPSRSVTQAVAIAETHLGRSRGITQILLVVEGSPPVPMTASTQALLVAEVSPVTVIATQVIGTVEATIPLPTARWAGPAAQII